MTATKNRLKRAKQAIAPPPEDKPYQVVYKQDDRYWIAVKPDYRQCIGGKAGERDITEAEFHDLEKTRRVLLVEYVNTPIPGST